MVDQPTFIYHFTHIEHLPSIIEKGLLSHNKRQTLNAKYINIAHQNIQQRRAKTKVPCGSKGTLHDYIPFYFATCSPMLYAIHKGKVENYQQGQEPLIYLVTTAQKIESENKQFVFSDGHPAMQYSKFFDRLIYLNNVDWKVMKSKYWNDFTDGRTRREAEFLVYEHLPWDLVTYIGVGNAAMEQSVNSILIAAIHKPKILIRPNWYHS